MIDSSKYTFTEEDLGPLKLAESTNTEYILGMGEQGKGVKISCPHDYSSLKVALVGNAGSVFIPDPDQPEMHNLLSASGSKEFMDFLRQHKGKHMALSFPKHYEKMKYESNMLAKTYRDNVVLLIRNETNTIPFELLT